MILIQGDMEKFHEQLEQGAVPRAYRALLFYMKELRNHFKEMYPNYSVSSLYQGYMDMTYFAVFSQALKKRDLKIAIVFNYGAFRFEAWLAGRNREINHRYWELFTSRKWPEYRVVEPAKGVDSIVEYDLAQGFALGDANTLTATIEAGTISFIASMEDFLQKY